MSMQNLWLWQRGNFYSLAVRPSRQSPTGKLGKAEEHSSQAASPDYCTTGEYGSNLIQGS